MERPTVQPPVDLTDQTPLAKGRQQLIYPHPTHRDKLIKVDHGDADKQQTRHSLREAQVYHAFRDRLAASQNPPLPRYFGAITTSLGQGFVYERIWNISGTRIAPTLQKLVRKNRMTAKRIMMLNSLVATLDEWDLPLTDPNARNIVFGARGSSRQFVLVDGFGDYRAIPLSLWLSPLRRKRRADGFARVAHFTGLRWDPAARRFRA